MNEKRLFLLSCIALIATAMSFAIRGDIMGDFEGVFSLDKVQLGWIGGAAFWGFGLSIIFGGPLCDIFGLGNILRMAAVGHIGGTLLTIFAPNFTVLFAATLLIGIANGLVEASINPLVATMYPDQKTKKLTLLHAWFPGGIIVGGLAAYALTQMGYGQGTEHGWKIKMGLLLIPAAIYAVMLISEKFPPTERAASTVPFSEMFVEVFRRPLFLIIFLCMWLTAATELGPGTWMANIFNDVMSAYAGAGILLLVWGNGIMYVLRQFAGGYAHRVTPIALIACTAPLAAIGLLMFSVAETPAMWFVAAAFLHVGVCFWWPTMLGITSERFPKTGALGMAIIGGAGSISTAVAGPVMGKINEMHGADNVLPIWSVLPIALSVIFAAIYFSDKARGGYRAQMERLDAGSAPPK